MSGFRRLSTIVAVAGCLLILLALCVTTTVQGQLVAQPGPAIGIAQPLPGGPPGMDEQPKRESGQQYSAVRLIEKSDYRRFIEVAQDCIKDKTWKDAVKALQIILDNPEDYYVRVKDQDRRTGEISERWTSVKYEANKLLGSMPQEGLDFYEQMHGARAQQMLTEAKKTGNVEILADVAQRYLHTKAGPEANDLLATYFLDRGQYFMAALRCERLLQALPANKVSDLMLLKATLAYRRAGEVQKADNTWQELLPRLRREGGLKVGPRVVSVEQIEKLLESSPRGRPNNPHDWVLVRGNDTNSAQANGSPPLLDELLWTRPTVRDTDKLTGLEKNGAVAKERISQAISHLQEVKDVPLMPGFFPIAVDGKLIYRSYFHTSAVYLHESKDEETGELVKPGDIFWRAVDGKGGLSASLEHPSYADALRQWLDSFGQRLPAFRDAIVCENSLVGTLSSDHRQVYVIDDLGVPMPPEQVQQFLFNQNQNTLSPQLREMVLGNTLQAFDVASGKLVWRQGLDGKNPDFKDSHFLGPPLPVGGKLYVLNEKNNGELRLVCLDPATGHVLPPVQNLGTVDQTSRFYLDPNRRIHAVHLAYGEGILVCPTNAGEVLGVDLLSRTLAWAYPYREGYGGSEAQPNQFIPPQALSLTPATWKVAPPVIQDGKVVFTAPDAHSLHCLNLRDGTRVWKYRKSDYDLFLAGVWNGKVILVGKNHVRALQLADGMQIWSLTTGNMPSGQGVASDNIYYLPLENGEICAIDLERGIIKAHNRPSGKVEHKPGNLVFYEGMVLSQTADHIVAYPQLVARLDLVKAAVQKDPTNLEKRTKLGELHLAEGQVQKAVQELRLVRAKAPAEPLASRVRQKLYEAMTDLFQADFDFASARYMEEYRELCKVPNDAVAQQEREAKFLRLLGHGREEEGNLVAAFKAYREFGSLPLYQKEGVPALDDPLRRIPAQVWLRARVSAMFARASAQQRKPLEEEVQKEWQVVRDSNQINAIRAFVNMFDVPFPVGQAARLHLANTIIQNNDRGSFLEAELCLEQLRTGDLGHMADVGGQALEALARLAVRRGSAQSMKLAAAYYQQLAREFPQADFPGGKTGQQLFNELAADKRFLPFLDEIGNHWPAGTIKARELPAGTIAADLRSFVFRPKGDLTPTTASLRLLLNSRSNVGTDAELKLVDVSTNKELWSTRLDPVDMNTRFFIYLYSQIQNNGNAYMPEADFRYFQVKGHLAVLQVGAMAYGIDLDNPRILWQRALLDSNLLKGVSPQNVLPDQDGRLVLAVYNPLARAPQQIRMGEVGTVQASYVCLLKQNNLEVVEPLTGKVLWELDNVSRNTRAFGDDEYIYLVDVSGGTASGARALRASDGTAVPVKDFSFHYRNQLHILGSRLLTAATIQNKLIVRLYDIPTGKDLWLREFPPGSIALQTIDRTLTGAIDPDGKVTVWHVRSNQDLMEGNAVQFRITKNDIKNLHQPLLLADADHFYVALNQPVDPQVVTGGRLVNNFQNGLHCEIVNGWVCAFHRTAGSRKIGGIEETWKKGDFDWHSCRPVANQMIVLDQFERMPLLLFSVRYNQLIQNNNIRGAVMPVVMTQSINKRTGKAIYWPPFGPASYSGAAPTFNALQIDAKAGTISLISFSRILQHYVDDGRQPTTEALNGRDVDGTETATQIPNQNLPGVVPPQPAIAPIRIRNQVIIQQNGQQRIIIQQNGQQRIIIRNLPNNNVPPPPPPRKR